MTGFVRSIFLFCGIALAFAALPVFGQEKTNEITINKRPLQDFGEFVRQKVNNRQVDLEKPFLVELESVLTKDGRLDLSKSKFIRSEGDAQMLEIAKQAILAVSDSGYFLYLSNLSVEKINFTISQDNKFVSAIIKSDVETVTKAKTVASKLNMIISLSKKKDKSEEEKLLLDGTSVTSKEKQFIINFAVPKPVAQEMIKRKLQNLEPKETEPNKTISK